MFPILALMLAADCPTDETATGRWRIRNGEESCQQIAEREARLAIPHRLPTAAEKARIQAHFDDMLFDGPAARWKWGNVVQGELACFRINAKNRMGAYTGWTRFTFNLKTGEEMNLDKTEETFRRLGVTEFVDICA